MNRLVSSRYIEDRGFRWAFRENAAKFLRGGESVIINLDDKANEGTHWVAAKIIGGILYYADPFGTLLGGYPPEENRITKKFIANRIIFQRPESALCGYYALCFAMALDCAASCNSTMTQKEFERMLLRSIE